MSDRTIACELMLRYEQIAAEILEYQNQGRDMKFIDEVPKKYICMVKKPKGRKETPIKLRKTRETYPRAAMEWTEVEKQTLISMNSQGKSHDEIATALGRQPTAIQAYITKLKKQGL